MARPRSGAGPGRPGAATTGRDLHEAVAAAAERDAGAPRRLLGSYVTTSARCAERATRLSARELDGIRGLGQTAAEEGIELRRLLDLYLSATWRLSEHLAGAHRSGDATWATSLFRASDDAAAALGEGYDRAQRRAIRREESVRRELIDDLLAGVVGDPQRDVSRQLGFNVAGVHRVVVARSGREHGDPGAVQWHVERQLLGERGGAGFVATKEDLLVCVVGGSGPPTGEAAGEAVLRLVDAVEPAAWVVAEGRPHAGPGGVARSFRDARDALLMASRLGLPDRLVRLADLLPYRVLAQDQALLQDTVDDVLGPLAGARGGAEPLIATLEAYFDEGLSTTATARRVHLSVRAVTYRLDRVAALTGRSLRDPRDRFALELAVRGRRLLAPDRFRDPATSAPSGDRP